MKYLFILLVFCSSLLAANELPSGWKINESGFLNFNHEYNFNKSGPELSIKLDPSYAIYGIGATNRDQGIKMIVLYAIKFDKNGNYADNKVFVKLEGQEMLQFDVSDERYKSYVTEQFFVAPQDHLLSAWAGQYNRIT